MKKCQHCGSVVSDSEERCPNCGSGQFETNRSANFGQNPKPMEESTALGYVILILCIITPFIGIIAAAIGMSSFKLAENKKLCKTGLIIASVILITTILMSLLIFLIFIPMSFFNF